MVSLNTPYYKPKYLLLLSGAATAKPAPEDQVAKLKAEIAAAKKVVDDILASPEPLALGPDKKPKLITAGKKLQDLRIQMLDLTDPGTRGYAVHGAREGGGGLLNASKFKFKQYGESGQWFSELLPNIATHADDLCFLRGLHTEGRMHINDLHATLLALMGIDHEKLTYRYSGRDIRLTDVAGIVQNDIFV